MTIDLSKAPAGAERYHHYDFWLRHHPVHGIQRFSNGDWVPFPNAMAAQGHWDQATPIYSTEDEAFNCVNQTPDAMPSKYHVKINGDWCDVYDVLQAFGVTNPGDQHAIKKMLLPGKRGHKDSMQDRREAIRSLERAIELEALDD